MSLKLINWFTFLEYLDYVYGVSAGLKAATRRTNPMLKFYLRGPAGLFKAYEKHELCWGLLNHCNLNITMCPIDMITFHRKGIESADDILVNSKKLIDTIRKIYPNLKKLSYSNTEADPSSGWSKPVNPYADVHYANILINIVFEHWNAMNSGTLNQLDSISHDNAFLSYHPYEFVQRTMLARFQMNNTQPRSTEFIQKPVYAALGMLASLANNATKVFSTKNTTYLVTMDKNYAAVILISNVNDNATSLRHLKLKLNITELVKCNENNFAYFVEYLQQNLTDPFAVWSLYGKPPYPNETVINNMHRAQGPHILRNPTQITDFQPIHVYAKLRSPWTLLVRICSLALPIPRKIKNVRIRKINEMKILILWNDTEYPTNERCIKTYEVFYANLNDINDQYIRRSHNRLWKNISKNQHIPFLSFHYQLNDRNGSLNGSLKHKR